MKRSNPKSARDTTSVFFREKQGFFFTIYINPIHKWLIYETVGSAWNMMSHIIHFVQTWRLWQSVTETAMDAGGPFDQCLQLWKGAPFPLSFTSEDIFHGVVGERTKRWCFFFPAFLIGDFCHVVVKDGHRTSQQFLFWGWWFEKYGSFVYRKRCCYGLLSGRRSPQIYCRDEQPEPLVNFQESIYELESHCFLLPTKPQSYYCIPSRELTYPPRMAFWRWFSFSQGGICEFPGEYT